MSKTKSKGKKFDAGKARFDLVYWPAVDKVAKVLEFGAGKYAPNNWQLVDNAEDRYFAAAMRHLIAWRNGILADDETGLSHLDHAMTNLMFLKFFEDNNNANT